MKIGILTFHWATNYGAILQAYALQEYLRSAGHSVDIIDYKPVNYEFSWLNFIRHPRSLFGIKKILIGEAKEQKLGVFRNKYLNLTKRYGSEKELDELSAAYDILISGSDQILNPSFTVGGEGHPTSAYYLKFASRHTKKIGYAVSFGCTDYPDSAKRFASEWIQNFDKIGVREQSGLSILNALSFDKEKTLVPDPTILYGEQLFENLNIKKPRQDNYICVYMLRKKVVIDSNNVVYMDETHKPVSMEEWLGFIKYSDGLITNSYHGMIMAILFHVPFAVVLERDTHLGMNDRFNTILTQLNLTSRQVINGNGLKLLNDKIDWNFIGELLSEYRETGISFLTIR